MKREIRSLGGRSTLLAAALGTALTAVGIAQAAPSAIVSASAASPTAPDAPNVATDTPSGSVEQRVGAELRAVMAELVESGAFGQQPAEQIAFAVNSPAQRVSDLGLLVDSAQPRQDGLHVLAVTPGSSADRMGLRAGDVLLALNGTSFVKDRGAAATLRQTINGLPDRGALTFEVDRDGGRQTVSGALQTVYLPAMHLTIGNNAELASTDPSGAMAAAPAAIDPPEQQGCGRISDFNVAPPQENLHAAKIILIDGVTPGPSGTLSYRVSAGEHTLQVGERIASRYLSFQGPLRNNNDIAYYKTLHVDVPPNTTVLVAARLNPDKRNVPAKGAYWDPVAWKQVPETCR